MLFNDAFSGCKRFAKVLERPGDRPPSQWLGVTREFRAKEIGASCHLSDRV
jgi:hypothetical protein